MRKLKPEEIANKIETANAYKVTIAQLNEEMISKAAQVKATKRQIKESTEYFNDLVNEIITGETEEEQVKLPLEG